MSTFPVSRWVDIDFSRTADGTFPHPSETKHSIGVSGQSNRASASAIAEGLLAVAAPS